MIRFEKVCFGYSPDVEVIHNLSFSIKAGEFLAIGGRNGSGKTTLTRLLMGLETPSKGAIVLEDTEITQLSIAERSRYIGYVFQQPDRQMFQPTVFEEIAFGPKQLGYTPQEVSTITEAVMEKVGLTDVATAYPLHLRRGLKQRIAIASALAMQSKVLILDEPTSGQDSQETAELLALLQVLHQEGLTILLITHDMDAIAAYCTNVFVMAAGTLVFTGTPETLFTEVPNLAAWGLAKPTSVVLAETLPALGYCPTMAVLQERWDAYRRAEQEGGDGYDYAD